MTGEINMSKLDTKPELEEKKKTGTLPKLKFTDYAIERFISTFNGNYRKYTSFDVSRNGALKLTYLGVIAMYAIAMAILSLFGKSSNEILNFLIIIPIIGQMLHFYLDSQLWKFSKPHNRENTLKFIKY